MDKIRFLKTVYDIGFKKLILRLFFEVRAKIDYLIPFNLKKFIYRLHSNDSIFEICYANSDKIKCTKKIFKRNFAFDFLNKKRILKYPFDWNNKNWQRLWQFNLHYFNWARDVLNHHIDTGEWLENPKLIGILIDDWDERNITGRGDGWHSYTLSLRCRNLLWIYNYCPELISTKRINSLWIQISWLFTHKEYCYGGNHLIENLTSLIICSLNFKGKKAEKIFEFSILELKLQLKQQILDDGGHYERSANYHLLILDRLVEVGLTIEKVLNKRPDWLLKIIKRMVSWNEKIRLINGDLPRFNDSPNDISDSLDEINKFAKSYLYRFKFNCKGLRKYLLSKFNWKENSSNPFYIYPNYINQICDLKNTGWIIIRPDENWEFIFKCGNSCPKDLPAHAHSDILSFDLKYFGKNIICECGTSTYEFGPRREYERSSAAHNVMQFGEINRKDRNVKWIEPIDVWGNFRAGNKANILKREYSKTSDNKFIVKGSHDGFRRIGIEWERQILLFSKSDKSIDLEFKEIIFSDKNVAWRTWWHLSENFNEDIFIPIINQLKNKTNLNYKWLKTSYSVKFGQRIKRKTLCLDGKLSKGENNFIYKLNISNISL